VPVAVVTLGLASAFAVQRIYTEVFSEAVFMPLVFAVAAALRGWERRPAPGRALLVGFLAALTVYVRWVGVAVVAWAGLMAAWWGWKRLTRGAWGAQMAAFLAGSGVPVALLLAYNRWRAGSSTNRHILWHPPGAEKWQQAALTVVNWLIPDAGWLQHYAPWALPWVAWLQAHPARFSVAAVAVLGVAGAVMFAAWRRENDDRVPGQAFRQWMLQWLAFVVVYFAAVAAAIAVVDASTPMDWRLLVPLFPPLLLLVVASLWRVASARPRLMWAFVVVGGVVVLLMARQARWTFFGAHRYGAILRSARWQEADIWPAARALPDDIMLLTNEMEATIYYTRRPAHLLSLPLQTPDGLYANDAVTRQARRLPYENLDAWAEDLASRWAGQCVAVVYVGLKERPREMAAIQALRKRFTVFFEGESGLILLPPGAEACLKP